MWHRASPSRKQWLFTAGPTKDFIGSCPPLLAGFFVWVHFVEMLLRDVVQAGVFSLPMVLTSESVLLPSPLPPPFSPLRLFGRQYSTTGLGLNWPVALGEDTIRDGPSGPQPNRPGPPTTEADSVHSQPRRSGPTPEQFKPDPKTPFGGQNEGVAHSLVRN